MRVQVTSPAQPDKIRWPLWLRAVLFSLAYFVSAELGHFFSFHPSSFSTFWPNSGLFVAVLLLSEPRAWPWLVLAVFPANISFDLLHGRPLWVSLLLTCGRSLEALAGAWLVRRWVGPRVMLTSLREVLGLATLSAALSTTLSATVGATLITAISGGAYWQTWVAWWRGDALGVLVVAPFVLTLGQARSLPGVFQSLVSIPQRATARREAEVALTLAGLVLCVWLVFVQPGDSVFERRYLLLSFVMWVALRFGLHSLAATHLGLALALM